MTSKLWIEQVQSLRERINAAERAHRHAEREEPDPPHIKEMRKIVDKYDNAKYRKERAIKNRVEKRARILKQEILFQPPSKMLVHVDRFEKTGK